MHKKAFVLNHTLTATLTNRTRKETGSNFTREFPDVFHSRFHGYFRLFVDYEQYLSGYTQGFHLAYVRVSFF